MSLTTALCNSYPRPAGTVVAGEVRHPSDKVPDPEVLRSPVLRFERTGREVLWDGQSVRSLPRDWREYPGAVDYKGRWEVAQRLRLSMERAGMPQTALAERLEISQAMIAQMLNPQFDRLSDAQVERIEGALASPAAR